MEEYKVRQATLDDKEEVLKIHDHVYDGRDYLPTYYDFILTSPNTTAFVLLHGDKVIGFKAGFIVDDGRTYVSRAGRMNPDYERKGLYRYLDNHVTVWARQAGVQAKAFTAVDANEHLSKASFKTENKLVLKKIVDIRKNRTSDAFLTNTHKLCPRVGMRKIMYTPTMLTFLFDAQTIKLGDSGRSALDSIQEIDDTQLAKHLESNDISNYLFPDSRFIVNWVPFRLLKSNIPFMRGPGNTTAMFSDIRQHRGTCQGLLSTGTVYPAQNPSYLCNLEIYGTDFKSLRQHLVRHIKFLQKLTTGVTSLLLFGYQELPVDKVVEFFAEHGVPRHVWYDSKNPDRIYSEQLLFERDLSS